MEPGTICIYGRTKIGKTLDVNRCFHKSLVLQAERGAITSVEANLGRVPLHIDCFDVDNPIEEMEQVIRQRVLPAIKKHGLSCVIFDTLSDWADRVFYQLDVELKHHGMQVYPRVGGEVRRMVRLLLQHNVWVVCICHEAAPKDLGGFQRGGPKLPGKLVEDTPGLFDLIMRATITTDAGSMDGASGGVKRVYQCDGLDSRWVSGDRYSVTKAEQPMDIRPLMYRILNNHQEPPPELLEKWGLDPKEWQ